jgi:SAM-dependent methyltransferase
MLRRIGGERLAIRRLSGTFTNLMEGSAYAEMYELEDQHWWFRGRRDLIWALLRSADLPAESRILDAGCGTGRNMVEFSSLGRVSGVDPSSDAVELCRKRGIEDVQCAGLEDLPFGPGRFQLLLACDVIEHVEDDILALGELFRVAARGATLIITAPAYQWMWTEHDVQLHHYRRYTLKVLRAQARAAGWTVERVTYFNTILLPVAASARLMTRALSRKGQLRDGRTDLDRTPSVLNGALGCPSVSYAGELYKSR